MQKFGLLFLAVSTALLGLVVPVQGAALTDRETNAKRFAQGLTPLPPRAVSEREGVSLIFYFFRQRTVADGGG